MMRPLPAILLLIAATTAAGACAADGIRLINPYPAAGPADLAGSVPINRVLRLMQNHAAPAITDTLANQVQQALAYSLRQTVEIERRPRQATLEAHRYVAEAAADGRTLLLSGNASIVILPRLADDGSAPARGTLVPVAQIARMPVVLITGAGSGLRTMGQLIAAARTAPARLHYGSSGGYSTAHLAGVLFAQRAGIRLVHVPYNGGTAAVNAVIAGQVESAFVALPAALPYLRSGQLHALGIATRERYPQLPNLPTFSETGFPGFDAAVWYGLFVPAATPQHIVAHLDSEIDANLHGPQSRALWLGRGVQAVHVGAAAFATLLREERARWVPVIDTIAAPG